MNSGELHAYTGPLRQPVRLVWDAGKILSVELTVDKPAREIWVAPPLMDLQINGYAGVDFQQDNVSEKDLLRAIRGLRRDGCTKFLLTLITDEWPRMMDRLRHYQALRTDNEEVRQAVMGFHVEGPFLSGKPGFCGAHDPALMQNPTASHLLDLRKVTHQCPVLLTIAPEWPATDETILRAHACGFHTNVGHTDATEAQLAAAVEKGARWFTHLGNGCPQTLDRHDNILWRVLDLHSLHVSLIPDGHHVSPALFRLIHRIKGDDIYYTTDAMSAGGAGPGKYRLGKLELEVQSDGVVRFPGGTNFAGSSLTPIAGVFKAAAMLNRSWQHVWKFFSTKPAYRMGMKLGMCLNLVDSLAVGEAAEFCILEFPDPQNHSLEGLKLNTVVPRDES